MTGNCLIVVGIFLILGIINWVVEVAIPAIQQFFADLWAFIVDEVVPFVFGVIAVVVALMLLALVVYSIRNVVLAIQSAAMSRRYSTAPEFKGESRVAYFFGPLWSDLVEFFGEQQKLATEEEQPIAGAAVAVSMVWNLVAVVLVTVAAALAWIWLGVMAVIDSLWIAIRGLIARCPSCHEQAFYLHYRCPSCSREHRHLRVNRAGALHHTCICGATIPSHVLTGRGGGQPARCVSCANTISGDLLQSKASYLALAGGTDSGKTTALVAVSTWLHEQLPKRGTDVELEDEVQRMTMARWMRDLPSGGMPGKTGEQRHRAFTFVLRPAHGRSRALYAFDTAGEMFGKGSLQQAHTYFESTGAVLFTLDPFSLQPLLEEMRSSSHWPAVAASSPSSMDPMDVAASLIQLMETNGARQRGGRFVAPVHVWITKTDVADLYRRLDLPESGIREWLEASGGEGVVRILNSSFVTVRYFATSAASSAGARRSRNAAAQALAAAVIPTNQRRPEIATGTS